MISVRFPNHQHSSSKELDQECHELILEICYWKPDNVNNLTLQLIIKQDKCTIYLMLVELIMSAFWIIVGK